MNLTRIFIALIVCAATACASSGQMNGWLESQKQPSGAVLFRYQSNAAGTGGTITATMPDSAHYSGKYAQITSSAEENSVSPMFAPWNPYWQDWGAFGQPWYPGQGYQTFRMNYSNKVIATLFGSDGRSMRCRFNLKDPPRGLSGNGNGECQLSTGGTISVLF